MFGNSSPQKSLTPLHIALLYALLGGLWILGSDTLAARLAPTPQSFITLEIYKGWFYIAITTGLLYLLISRSMRAVQNSEEELRRRNRELDMLNQIIAALAAGQEVEAVLDMTCRELVRVFGVMRATAALLNEGRTEVTVVAGAAVAGTPPASRQTLAVKDHPWLQYLLQIRSPLVIHDARQTAAEPALESLCALLRQGGGISFLVLPLLIAEEMVGGLALETPEPYHFSPDEISLAWSVADQVAGAMARARLAQTHRRLITAIEQTSENVIITDTRSTILYVNPAFERISGYSRAEVLGRDPRMLQSGKHSPDFYRKLWATLQKGQVWQGRLINRKQDGTLYTVEATISPVRDERGAIVNYVEVSRDVTAELRLEEQYRQAQKMEAIGRLAGGVAHDFNNILTVITGYTNLLLGDPLDACAPLYEDIGRIKRAAERAASLVRQLLAFSRKQVLQPELLDLNLVVGNIEKMLRRLIGEDINLVTRPDPQLGRVMADPGQIEQVIMNLAVNARDAMPGGGTIVIETGHYTQPNDATRPRPRSGLAPGSYAVLTISDTGAGMDEEVKSHIFEPFFTTKEQGKGTGLGLATVYGIVKQSGGEIEVDSEPGRGTTFRVYLPQVAPAGRPEPAHAVTSPLPGGSETILLAEDDDMVCSLVRRTLSRAGYQVLGVSHGREALQLAGQYAGSIDLLLTDVVMPGMSGHDLALALRAARPQMKVLYISGYADSTIVQPGLVDPGVDFLAKPFTPDVLARKIRQVLDGSRLP